MQRKRTINRDFSIDFNSLKSQFSILKDKYSLSDKEIFKLLKEEQYFIPVSVFSKQLSSLETISKYLKENQNLNFSKIASLLNRNPRTIWGAYSSAIKRNPEKLSPEASEFFIPTSIFTSRKLSVLESIVVYLKDRHNLSYHKIAVLLNRDDRTIWTSYSRARKKYVK